MIRILPVLLLPGVMLCTCASYLGGGEAVARVNGETITRSQLFEGVPKGISDPRLEAELKVKLHRLIDLTLRRQILRSESIRVPRDEVDTIVRKHYKDPLPASCACCRSRTLEEYMRNHLMTEAEYAESIRTSLGLQKLVERKWQEAFGDREKLEEAVRREKERLLEDYVKVSEIVFSKHEPEGGGPEAKARKAWNRLAAGEDFHALARELSENEETGPRGGERGCLLFLHFLPEVRKALKALEPGGFTRPIRSFDGAVILLRQPIGDGELADLLREEFERKTYLGTLRKRQAEARIEIMWSGGSHGD